MWLAAIELDPQYAHAYSNLAMSHANDVVFRYTKNSSELLDNARRYAETALELDPTSPQVYFSLAIINLAKRRHQEALAAAVRSVEIDPSYADGHGIQGWVLSHMGESDRAIAAIDQARRLHPQTNFVYETITGHAHFLAKRFEKAEVALKKALAVNPGIDATHVLLAATLAHAGRIDEAEWHILEALSNRPEMTLASEREDVPHLRQADRDYFIEGLRLAGLPEQ